MKRFHRIQKEFGTTVLLRTFLLLIGLLGMALLDYFVFSSVRAVLIAVSGLALGFLFRRWIVEGVEYYRRVISIGLLIYSVTLLLGDRMGLENSGKLAVITATTVVIFDLQFWSLSDTSVVNAERE